jgi:hypothetical protein
MHYNVCAKCYFVQNIGVVCSYVMTIIDLLRAVCLLLLLQCVNSCERFDVYSLLTTATNCSKPLFFCLCTYYAAMIHYRKHIQHVVLHCDVILPVLLLLLLQIII